MNETELRKLSDEYLVPLFSGARLLGRSSPSSTSEQRVSFVDQQTIEFKVLRQDKYRLAIRRAHRFSTKAATPVTEIDVVEAFVDAVSTISSGLSKPYRADLLANFQRNVVARAVLGPRWSVLLTAIDQLDEWSKRLYEGAPIAAGIGFKRGSGGETMELLSREKLSQVMSNGFDTLLAFDFSGKLLGHEALAPGRPTPHAPNRYGAVSRWTRRGNVAVTLNRLGEILVFRGERLIFARRSGKWHFLTHDPIVTQMQKPHLRAVRTAIYESALDASFARTGACIGVVTPPHRSDWQRVVPELRDYLLSPTSAKAHALSRMVSGRPFQDLERELRQELLAIDGATVLGADGEIYAIGTIVRISGGSGGGGREAAAIELSTLGLGVKVSQDGRISGYHDGNEDPVFTLL